MRILKLEIKRVLTSRLTLILMLVSLLFSVLLAYLPTTFCYSSYRDENGNLVELSGLSSIRYEKKQQAGIAGEVTSEKVRQAVFDYQACLDRYGVEKTYDLPEGIYEKEILPYAPLLHGVKEAFADRDTGIAPDLTEIVPEKLDDYYLICRERLASLMNLEQGDNQTAVNVALRMYDEVEKPYLVYPGFNSDAMDYEIMLGFLIVLFAAVIAAPVFSFEYQTGADDILRCTKFGRVRFGLIKVLSTLLICIVLFAVCVIIHITISNSLFGWECTKTSIQMLYSIVTLADMNLGQLQWFVAGASLLCMMATVAFTLFLSSKCRNMVVALAGSLLFCILPVVVAMIAPVKIGTWICSLLPAGGVGLQASILYAVLDFNFLKVGSTAVWTPYVMIGAALLEIPLFIGLAVFFYSVNEN